MLKSKKKKRGESFASFSEGRARGKVGKRLELGRGQLHGPKKKGRSNWGGPITRGGGIRYR